MASTTSKQYDQSIRRMLNEESVLGAYDVISSSVKTDDFNFGAGTGIPKHKGTDDQSESTSVVSYATSVYSEQTVGTDNGKKVKKFQKIIPYNKNQIQHVNINQQTNQIQHVRMNTVQQASKKINPHPYNKQLLSTIPQTDYGGGLHQKLKTHYKIRESMEMDVNTSLQSRGSVPSARISVIKTKSVITLRMISSNPSKQIRIKLYLPLSTIANERAQIIVLFVNKGTTMGLTKSFLEDSYPHGMLKDKIKQLCIADDDGDIDEDFPPINENQDITSLGIQNFWVDRIFDNDNRKPSVVYENNDNDRKDKHRGTLKEQLVKGTGSTIDYGNYDDIDNFDQKNKENKCCWCCLKKRIKRIVSDGSDDDDDLRYSTDNVVEIQNKNVQYLPPSNDNNNTIEEQYDPANRHNNVQYASL